MEFSKLLGLGSAVNDSDGRNMAFVCSERIWNAGEYKVSVIALILTSFADYRLRRLGRSKRSSAKRRHEEKLKKNHAARRAAETAKRRKLDDIAGRRRAVQFLRVRIGASRKSGF